MFKIESSTGYSQEIYTNRDMAEKIFNKSVNNSTRQVPEGFKYNQVQNELCLTEENNNETIICRMAFIFGNRQVNFV